jgi:hypothetical protein
MDYFSSSNFAAFAAALAQRESSDNEWAINKWGYVGKYQFGNSAVTDAG